MKKLGIAIIVVVALALGLPYVFGMRTEALVNERTAAMSSDFVTFEVKSFERGWFRSHANIEMGLGPQYAAMAAMSGAVPPSLGLAVEFAHGPIAVLDGPYFGMSKMVATPDPATPGLAQLQQQLGVPQLFEFRGALSFFNTLAYEAEVPAITMNQDGAQVQFSGATAEGTFDGKRFTTNARVDAFAVDSPLFTFALTNMRADSDNEKLVDYVWPGETAFSIERISAASPLTGAGPLFDASNLRFTSNVAVNRAATAVDMLASYDLDSLVSNDVRIASATLGMAFRNLDVEFLKNYVELVQNAAVVANPEALLAQLLPAVERGLAAGPSFTLEPVRFTMDDEPFDARVEVTTDPTRLPAAGSLDLQDPSLLFAILGCNAEMTVSKKLAARLAGMAMQGQMPIDPNLTPEEHAQMAEAQAGLMLVTLVGQGILTDAGESYHTEVRLANGALLLNGNPMPFAF